MTAIISEAPVSVELTNKSLISDQLWTRLTNRVLRDLEFQQSFGKENETIRRDRAERIISQALAYLQLCATATSGESYSPSPLVDIGWHTFILYTRDYADFCEKVAGRFIHHSPSDVPGVDYGKGNVARTVAAMKVRGISVDEPLWLGKAECMEGCSGELCASPDSVQMAIADCSNNCSDGNCDNHA